jgi:hypothetical protein
MTYEIYFDGSLMKCEVKCDALIIAEKIHAFVMEKFAGELNDSHTQGRVCEQVLDYLNKIIKYDMLIRLTPTGTKSR